MQIKTHAFVQTNITKKKISRFFFSFGVVVGDIRICLLQPSATYAPLSHAYKQQCCNEKCVETHHKRKMRPREKARWMRSMQHGTQHKECKLNILSRVNKSWAARSFLLVELLLFHREFYVYVFFDAAPHSIPSIQIFRGLVYFNAVEWL